MTPITHITPALAELMLAMHTIRCRAADFALQCAQRYGADPCSEFWPENDLSDHRVAIAGDLAAALNAINPGMGNDLMQAMYPELDLGVSTDEALAHIQHALATGRLMLAHDALNCDTPETPGQGGPLQ